MSTGRTGAAFGGQALVDFLADHDQDQDWIFGVIGGNSTSVYEALPTRPGALRFGLHGLLTAQAHHLPITFYVDDKRAFGSTEMFADQMAAEMGRRASSVGSDFSRLDRGIADTLAGFGIPTISVVSTSDPIAQLPNDAVP